MQDGGSRLIWFKGHIGRVVFRTRNGCDCKPCAIVYEEGLIVRNIVHANHLVEMEIRQGTKYFGSKKDRDEYVATVAQNLPHIV